MKKSTKIVLIILALALAFGLWMFWPRDQHITDPDRYGRYNKYTREQLADFAGILPESIPEGAQDVIYSCDYVEGVDRSFIIDLAYTLDEENYYAEKSRLGHLAEDSRLIDGVRYYVCSTGDLDEFFNDTVLVGYTYRVEIAVCDDETHSIRCVAASYVEGMTGGDKVGEVLRPIYDNDQQRTEKTEGLPKVLQWTINNKVE